MLDCTEHRFAGIVQCGTANNCGENHCLTVTFVGMICI